MNNYNTPLLGKRSPNSLEHPPKRSRFQSLKKFFGMKDISVKSQNYIQQELNNKFNTDNPIKVCAEIFNESSSGQWKITLKPNDGDPDMEIGVYLSGKSKMEVGGAPTKKRGKKTKSGRGKKGKSRRRVRRSQ